MIHHPVAAARAAGLDPVIVVTGHEAGRVRAALDDFPVEFAHNPMFETGLAGSLAVGIDRVAATEAAGAVVLLGDMPRIDAAILETLVARFRAVGGDRVCRPVHDGRPGNPVLLPRRLFARVRDLTGDTGARVLLAGEGDRLEDVRIDSEAVLFDVDHDMK